MVERSAAPAQTSGLKGETQIVEPSRAERAMVRRAAEARATVPDLELDAEVDMAGCVALRREQGCSITAILVRACALALRDVPRANAAYRDGRFELYSRVNIGVTVETQEGFVVPTVIDADRKSLVELADEIDTLASRAHAGALSAPEFSGATFTLSDLSAHGVARWSTLVNPPQAAALTAGAIQATPTLREGTIVPGETMIVTLGCDHRILYGAGAARFLTRIQTLLAQAEL